MTDSPMTALNKQAELRKELSNPAIGSNHHLRKLALSLLDDLDGKEGRIKELDSQRALAFMACNRWRDKFNEAEAKLEAAEKRIAELEARKFKVEMPEPFYPDGDIDAPLAVDELEVIAAIVEAGGKPVAFCKRCDREIDLTHRPDGSHYCHAPAAGLGVKGE
ncbi:hypothetical protein [Citrobacter europaeus]|uniref:hypothetical protein n=1 Tax=Citrobacter europaeus TaxID=1914243 RepID=UPI003979EABB